MGGSRAMASMVIAVTVLLAAFASPAGAVDVSLGDSYSSGEGASAYDTGTKLVVGNGCHRTARAWPRLLGVLPDTHFACSGATTSNFFAPQKAGLLAGPDSESQLTRLQDLNQQEPIGRVFVTIGGNDAGFASIVRNCFVDRHCLRNLNGALIPRLESEIRQSVAVALLGARLAAPNADVILVGYPDLIPPRGRPMVGCGWIDDAEKPRFRALEEALDTNLRLAALAAGVPFISIRDSLDGHELCTEDSWMNPVVAKSKPRYHESGHPNADGQRAMAVAVARELRMGAGAAPPPQPGCTPATSIAAIIDDSDSMRGTDPLSIRQAAMQLLITKPDGILRTLGATEFGTDAGPLFAPNVIATSQLGMLLSLGYLADDGYGGGETNTNYNAAFAESTEAQPGAQARIFLTDGGHNVDDYLDLHRGGPRTYVIGLDIGPAGEGDEEADRLHRIATETGGAYFPLRRDDGDTPSVQTARLQPVFNAIDALIDCDQAPAQTTRVLKRASKRSKPVTGIFGGSDSLELVASWPDPAQDVDFASVEVHNANGRLIANLTGKRPKHGKHKKGKVSKLQSSLVEGSAFDTLSIARPANGTSVEVTVTSSNLSAPTSVVVQIAPNSAVPTAPSITVPPAEPPPPVTSAVLTVDNRVTNGGSMREDSTPTRLTTAPRAFCGSRGCNIAGTERSSGGTYDSAVCQTSGERITNGNDQDPSDDGNPERFESTRYYGVRLSNGVFGYVSEVWIRASDRGGKGLPQC